MYSVWSFRGWLGGRTVEVVGKGVISRSAKFLSDGKRERVGLELGRVPKFGRARFEL